MEAVTCTRVEEESSKAASAAASRTQVLSHRGGHEATNVKDNEAVEPVSLRNQVRTPLTISPTLKPQPDSRTDVKNPEEVVTSPAFSFSTNTVVQKEREACLGPDETVQKGDEVLLGQLQNWFGATANQHLQNSDILMALNSPFSASLADNVESDLSKATLSTRALQFWDKSVAGTEKPSLTSSSSLNIGTPETLAASQSAAQGSGSSTNTSAVIARTLSLQFHKTRMCPFFERGHCRKGVECTYAHDRGELRSAPNLYKTKLCEEWQRGTCRMEANCRFAHGRQELRFTDQVYKTRICHFWSTGDCSKGRLCRHAHGYHELRLDPNLALTGRALQLQEDDQRCSKIMSGRSGLLPITASRTCPTGSSKRRDTSPLAPAHWRGAIRRENEGEYKDVKAEGERKIRRCFTTVGFQQLADSVNSHLQIMDAQHNDTPKLTDSRWSMRRSSSLHDRSSFIDLQLQALVSDRRRMDSQCSFQAQNNTYVSEANESSPRKLEAYSALNSCPSNTHRALMLINSASSPALQSLCQSPLTPTSRKPPLVSLSKAQSIEQVTAKNKGSTNSIGLAEQFQRVAQHAIQQSVCQLGKHPVFTREVCDSRQDNLTGVLTARGSSRARTSPIPASPFLGDMATDVENSAPTLSPLRSSTHDSKSTGCEPTGCLYITDRMPDHDAVAEAEIVQNASKFTLSISSLKQQLPDFCNHEESASPLSRLSSSASRIEGSAPPVVSGDGNTGVGSAGNPSPLHSPASEMSLCQSSTSLSSSLSTLPQAQNGGSSMERIAHIYDISGVSPTMTTVHNPQDTSPSRTLSSDPFERQSSDELLRSIQHKDEQHGLDSDASQSRQNALYTVNGSLSIFGILRQEVCDSNMPDSNCWDFAGQSTTAATVAGFSPQHLGLHVQHRQQQCEGNVYREPPRDGDRCRLNSASHLINVSNLPDATVCDRSLNKIGVPWNMGVDPVSTLPHAVVQVPGGGGDAAQQKDSDQEQPTPHDESQPQPPHTECFLQQPVSSPLLPVFHLGEKYVAGLNGGSQASVEASSNINCCQNEPLGRSLHTSNRPEVMSPPPGLAAQRKNMGPSSLNCSAIPQQPPDASWGAFLGRLSSETGLQLTHDSGSVEKQFPRYRSFRYPAAQQSSTKTEPTNTLPSCLVHNLWQSQLPTLDTGERPSKVSPSINPLYNAPSVLPTTTTAISGAQDVANRCEERGNHSSSTPSRLRRPRRSVSAFFLPRWLSAPHEDSVPPISDSSDSITRIPLTLKPTTVHNGADDPRSDCKSSQLPPQARLSRSRTPTWEEGLDLEYSQYAATSGNYSDVLLPSSPTAKNYSSSVSQEAVGFQSHFTSTAFNNSYRFPSNTESGRANHRMPVTAATGPSSFARGSSMPCPGFTPSSLLPDFLQPGPSTLEWTPINSFSGADILSSFHGYNVDGQCDNEKGGMWHPQEQPCGVEELHGFRKTPRSSTLFASPIRGIPRAERIDDPDYYHGRDLVPTEFRPVLHTSTSMEIDRMRARRMLPDFSEAPNRSGCYMMDKPSTNSTTNRENFREPTSLLSFLSRRPHKNVDTRDDESRNVQGTQDDWCSRIAAEFLSDGSENTKHHREGHSVEIQGPQESSGFTPDTAPLPWLLRFTHGGMGPSPLLLQAKTAPSTECAQQVSKGDGGIAVSHTASNKENTEWNEQPVLAGIPSAEFRPPQTTIMDHKNTTGVKLVNVTSDMKQTTSSEKGEEDDNEKKGRVCNIPIRNGVEEELSECSSEAVVTSLNASSFPKTGNIVGLFQNTSLCEIFKNYLQREESQKQKNLGSLERLKEAVFQGASTHNTIAVPQELQQTLPGDEQNVTQLKYYASEANATLQTLRGSLTAVNSGFQNHFQVADLSTRTPETALAMSHIDSVLPH